MDSKNLDSNTKANQSFKSGKKELNGETCVICEQKKEKGIHIYTQFICNECEQEIIHTETTDEKYVHYLNQMRKITEPMLNTN